MIEEKINSFYVDYVRQCVQRDLMEEYGLTQDEVSKKVGKSRSAVANSVRLLNLPDAIKAYIKDGKLSMGHARTLLGIEDEKRIKEVADKIIVRQKVILKL